MAHCGHPDSSENQIKLFKHQEKAVEFILACGGSGAIFHEVGTGKTRTALKVFDRLLAREPALRMLVVAPLSLLEAAWAEDARRFLGNECWNIRKNGFPENRNIRTSTMIYLINYERLLSQAYYVSLVNMIKEYGLPWMCVLDESSRIKNHSAKTTKILLKMAPLFKHRIVMSGTPAPNSETEYWPQIKFVDPDRLNPSFTAFRSHFFHLVNRYTGRQMAAAFTSRAQAAEVFRKCEYRITPERREALMRSIMPVCHLARKVDCLDLPDQVDEVREVELAPNQRLAYDGMKRHLVVEIQDQHIAAPVALTKLMKLRQITSGFIYSETGESFEINAEKMREESLGGDPIFLVPEKEFSNPKLQELFDVIDEAGPQPMIIWITFHWELIKICHELHKRFGADQVATLSALTKDKDGSIAAFRDGKARFLCAHPRSAGHGLTFINCSLEIFFSLDFSWESHEQARGRIHRAGQTKKCTYIYINAKNTIDQDILAVLRRKGDAQEILYKIIGERNGKNSD